MIRIDIKKTKFYNELTPEKQKENFYVKSRHTLSCFDNIYYTCFIKDDCNNNESLISLLDKLKGLKKDAIQCRSHVPFNPFFIESKSGVLTKEPDNVSLVVAHKGFSIYKYCIFIPNLYDIYVLNYLPNNYTPRILVKIHAFGLWIHGTDKMIIDSFETVKLILADYGVTVEKAQENRINYCYHTNAIKNPDKFITEEYLKNYIDTTMKKKYEVYDIKKKKFKNNNLDMKYISFGEIKSNNVYIKIYNKALDIVENSYNGFYFDIWYKNNLIGFYDKYCFESAYIHKDFLAAVEKAKMKFYLEYGTDNLVKEKYKTALSSCKIKYTDLKDLTNGIMPDLTCIMNVEYETKSKFYNYSNNMIDNDLEVKDRGSFPTPLARLFKILDNKAVFLDYLTSKTLSFKKNDKYVDWWEALRKSNHNGFKHDITLLREYNQNLHSLINQKD